MDTDKIFSPLGDLTTCSAFLSSLWRISLCTKRRPLFSLCSRAFALMFSRRMEEERADTERRINGERIEEAYRVKMSEIDGSGGIERRSVGVQDKEQSSAHTPVSVLSTNAQLSLFTWKRLILSMWLSGLNQDSKCHDWRSLYSHRKCFQFAYSSFVQLVIFNLKKCLYSTY